MLTALGGNHASPVIQAELARFQEYKASILALVPINTEEKARQYREILKREIPELIPIFHELLSNSALNPVR